MDPAVDILVLSAHGPELRGMIPHLGESLEGQIRGLRVAAKLVGVGLPVAGASAARRLEQIRPRAVIHLGTCGVYPGLADYRPLDVAVGQRVFLLDHAVLAGRAAFPAPMTTEIEPDRVITTALAAGSQRARPAPVASPLAPTTDDTVAAAVPSSLLAHVENLEAFSIGHACRAAQVPWGIVLGTTHMVGSRAQEDFRQFERSASLAAAELVVNWIHNGAQGVPHG